MEANYWNYSSKLSVLHHDVVHNNSISTTSSQLSIMWVRSSKGSSQKGLKQLKVINLTNFFLIYKFQLSTIYLILYLYFLFKNHSPYVLKLKIINHVSCSHLLKTIMPFLGQVSCVLLSSLFKLIIANLLNFLATKSFLNTLCKNNCNKQSE